jgi:hypothetical protein
LLAILNIIAQTVVSLNISGLYVYFYEDMNK